jgi:hypothetical protein
MGTSVVVRDRGGETVIGLIDVAATLPPPPPPVQYTSLIAPGTEDAFPLLAGIDPYGSTIFNRQQSHLILRELDQIEAGTTEATKIAMVRALRVLIAEQHAKQHRFLWFLGD